MAEDRLDEILQISEEFSDETPEAVFAPAAPVVGRGPVGAVLFVGLGGTGAAMLAQVHRRVQRVFGRRDGSLPEAFQFLAIDTDPNALQFPAGSGIHTLALQNFNGNQFIEGGGRQFVQDWFPEKYRPGSVVEGAHQARCVGRLALFYGLVNNRWADLTEPVNKAAAALGPNEPPPVIYVFGSVCGGTGAGMAIDIAYLLRHAFLAQAGVAETRAIGVFVEPGVFSDVRGGGAGLQLPANAYAMLKELDHFHSYADFPLDYPGVYGIDIEALTTAHVRPFQIFYLVGLSNEVGKRLGTRGELYALVGDYVLHEFMKYQEEAQQYQDERVQAAAGTQSALQSHLDNPSGFITERIRGQNLAPVLSGLGYAAYVYPRERIRRYATLQLAGAVLRNGFLGAPAEGFEAQERVKQFILTSGLEEASQDAVIDFLRMTENGRSLSYSVSPETLLGDPCPETISLLDQHEQRLAQQIAAADRHMAQRRTILQQQALAKLDQWCGQVASVSQGKLPGLAQFLTELQKTLITYRGLMEAEQQEQQAKRQQSEAARERSKQEAKEVCQRRGLFGIGYRVRDTMAVLEEYAAACSQTYNYAVQASARHEAQVVYSALAGSVRARLIGVEALVNQLGEVTRKWSDRAQWTLRGAKAADETADESLEVAHLALDAEGIEQLYKNYEDKQKLDPLALATQVERELGSVWAWLRPPWEGEEERYYIGLKSADLSASTSKAVQGALEGLMAMNLLDAVGVEQAQARVLQVAKECQNLWNVQMARIEGGHVQKLVHHAVVALPGITGEWEDWQPIYQAVERGMEGVSVMPLYTGNPDRITIARSTHGVPPYALTRLAAWKQGYTERVQDYERFAGQAETGLREGGPKPVHLDMKWVDFPDLFPGGEDYLLYFALGCSFPVTLLMQQGGETPRIINARTGEVGSHFYVYPYPERAGARIEAQRLGQGLVNAFNAFNENEDLLASIKRWFAPVARAEHAIEKAFSSEDQIDAIRRQRLVFNGWRAPGHDPREEQRNALLDRLCEQLERYAVTRLKADPNQFEPLTD